jgi:hypothetical protein
VLTVGAYAVIWPWILLSRGTALDQPLLVEPMFHYGMNRPPHVPSILIPIVQADGTLNG